MGVRAYAHGGICQQKRDARTGMFEQASRDGQRVGNYRLLRLLGRGGFAEVYLAEHIHLNTQAAVKLLRTQLANEDMEGFRNEARMIAGLVHPHIVRVLDFGVEESVPYLVMDYAPNGTLRQRHPRGARLPLQLVVGYVQQIAGALQYAHEQRLIHRDIKPENMLVGRNNEALLSDFGIALSGHTDSVWSLSWSHNGRYIASGSADATARVWDGNSGKLLLIYNKQGDTVRVVSWSPDDSRIVSGGMSGPVYIWASDTGQTLLTYGNQADFEVLAAAWSHKGKYIASAGGSDANTHIWNAQSGQLLRTFPSESINSVSWSPDDSRIVTANNNVVQVWQI